MCNNRVIPVFCAGVAGSGATASACNGRGFILSSTIRFMIPNIKAERSIFYHSLITGILVFIGTLAILALLTTVMTNRLGSHIFPNVYINSYNVGNLTKDQASKLISRSNAPFAKTSVTVLYKSDPRLQHCLPKLLICGSTPMMWLNRLIS